MTSQPEVSRCCSTPERPRPVRSSRPCSGYLRREASRASSTPPRRVGLASWRGKMLLGKRPQRNCRAHAPIPPAADGVARGLGAHRRTARAGAIPTPTAESPPTTEASHTTSRASSRTDFHIGGLPPLRGRSTARAGHWFLARAPYHGISLGTEPHTSRLRYH